MRYELLFNLNQYYFPQFCIVGSSVFTHVRAMTATDYKSSRMETAVPFVFLTFEEFRSPTVLADQSSRTNTILTRTDRQRQTDMQIDEQIDRQVTMVI